jgi:hypothetical protein
MQSNSDNGSEDEENQDIGSKKILEEASAHINGSRDTNPDVTISEWQFTH